MEKAQTTDKCRAIGYTVHRGWKGKTISRERNRKVNDTRLKDRRDSGKCSPTEQTSEAPCIQHLEGGRRPSCGRHRQCWS